MKLSNAVCLLMKAALAVANVEKTIFLGPAPVPVPQQPPTLSDLNLHTLTPGNNSIRTRLDREFPGIIEETGDESRGVETWWLLDDLTEGQRYEVRVCWAAIEPTSFDIDAYQLNTVWETPSLIQSLAAYAFARTAPVEDRTPHIHHPSDDDQKEKLSSVLLLRVVAAADYFTDNADLMRSPRPVLVDLILDPFVLNVLPRSLLPTAGYIIGVAVMSAVAARCVMAYLRSVAGSPGVGTKKTQ